MLLSMTTIVLRHLNSGPFDPAGDVGIPMHELSDAAVDRWRSPMSMSWRRPSPA